MSKSNGNGVDKKGVKLDLEDTTEYGTKPEQPKESVRHDIVIGNGEDERLKQSTSRKAPKVTVSILTNRYLHKNQSKTKHTC